MCQIARYIEKSALYRFWWVTCHQSLCNKQHPLIFLQLPTGLQISSPHFTHWSAVTVRIFLVRRLPLASLQDHNLLLSA